MATNPYVNKVVYGADTIIDISGTTATADKILQGYGAFGSDGSWLDGTAVAGGGGSSNFLQGTFTTNSTAGVQTVTISYTGSGYPIMVVVVVNGGAYNSAISGWYNSAQRYAVGQYTMTKSVMTSAPTYGQSGTENYGVTTTTYKGTSSTSYARTGSTNTNFFSSSDATNSSHLVVRMRSSTSMSVYVNTSGYGLLPNTEYAYYFVYSS